MSTRATIAMSPPELEGKPGDFHLFSDVMEDYGKSGLHLDIIPGRDEGTGQYGDFDLTITMEGRVSLSLRIPVEVCEAIADYVAERRAFVVPP